MLDYKVNEFVELSEIKAHHTMKNYFNGEGDSPGNVMECPEFGKLITVESGKGVAKSASIIGNNIISFHKI